MTDTTKTQPNQEQDIILQVKHLRKVYPEVTPIENISLDVRRGEVISIIGPSGTGKSTFLRCLNRMEEPTSGEIWVLGENTCAPHYDMKKMRMKMGMVFQSFNLFSNMTILDNITCGPRMLLGLNQEEAEKEARDLLAQVGLAGRENQWPEELSGGQKQRVAIARTLAMHPEIILFDEPTSALDPRMVGEVLSVIRNLAGQGITMLIVTHEMHFAEHVSTRVLYLDQGMVYEDGSPEQIFHSPRRERTRDFIQNLQVFQKELPLTEEMDYLGLEGELMHFAKEHFVKRETLTGLQHVADELVSVILEQKERMEGEVVFSFRCTQDGEYGKIALRYPGTPVNFLPEGELRTKIIKAYVKNVEERYEEERNVLELWFK